MMPQPLNILILIHGMIPKPEPYSHEKTYSGFWRALLRARPVLEERFAPPIYVQWGHELPDAAGELRDDEKLTRVQQFVIDRVAFDKVRRDPDPNNWVINEHGIPFVRKIFTQLRERTVLRGLGDAVYYCSKEGEQRVRREVYRQILEPLDRYLNREEECRLHLFGHSLGVTLTHDFLYGLFGSENEPGFVAEHQGRSEDRERYQQWRAKARAGFRLGSLTSAASQLPLFVMRKQQLVDRLARGETLSPSVIGIDTDHPVRWKIFYDVDDILGFATRRLYSSHRAIMDIQVDTGDTPGNAHDNYWRNRTVIEETADMLDKNSQ